MYTLCEQFNATDMKLDEYYKRRAEIEQKHRNVEVKALEEHLHISVKATAVAGHPENDKAGATAPK